MTCSKLQPLTCAMSGVGYTRTPTPVGSSTITLQQTLGSDFPTADGGYFYVNITWCDGCCSGVKVIAVDGDVVTIEPSALCGCIPANAKITYDRTSAAYIRDLVGFNVEVASPLHYDCETNTLSISCDELKSLGCGCDEDGTGSTGGSGLQGPKGEKGDTGPAGPAGPKGDTGPPGIAGSSGPQGAKGDTGAQGPKGDTGATGAQGLKGDTGDTGAQGATGATGPMGPAGPGWTYVRGTSIGYVIGEPNATVTLMGETLNTLGTATIGTNGMVATNIPVSAGDVIFIKRSGIIVGAGVA